MRQMTVITAKSVVDDLSLEDLHDSKVNGAAQQIERAGGKVVMIHAPMSFPNPPQYNTVIVYRPAKKGSSQTTDTKGSARRKKASGKKRPAQRGDDEGTLMH
ncbi:MAG: hypothetical protein HY461_00830 [Parcubacteria group bacterium]|nr:hypothetical protein [Parcubacteria group bacterium]